MMRPVVWFLSWALTVRMTVRRRGRDVVMLRVRM